MTKSEIENQIKMILEMDSDAEPTADVSDWVEELDNVQIWDDEPKRAARAQSAIETAALKLLNECDAEFVPFVVSPNSQHYALNYCRVVAQYPSFTVSIGEWAEYWYGVDEDNVDHEWSDVEVMARELAKCRAAGALGISFPKTRGEAEYLRKVGKNAVSLANTIALYRKYGDAEWEQHILDGIIRLAADYRMAIYDGLADNEITFNETNDTCNYNYTANRWGYREGQRIAKSYPDVLAELGVNEK